MGHLRPGFASMDPLAAERLADRLAERLLALLAEAGLRAQLLSPPPQRPASAGG